MIRRRKTKTMGVRYAVRVHVGNGRYEVIGTYATRAKAKQVEADWLLRTKGRERRTGNEWANFYLEGYEQRVKVSSFESAQTAIKCWRRTFGTRTLNTIDPTEAEEWARKNAWAVPAVVTMLNNAIKKDVLDRNPFAGLSRRSPGRKHHTPLSVAEVEKLAAAAEREHGKGVRSFVLFTAYSGMRVGEVFALQWPDIDFRRNRIMVRRRLYRGDLDLPKSNKAREIALLPEARDALLGQDRSTDWVFLGKRGGQMNQAALFYYWQKIESALERKVTPHELKHFCGHHLYVTKRLPDRVVAVQLGHNDGGKLVRELYGHGDVGALEEIERVYGDNVVPIRRASSG